MGRKMYSESLIKRVREERSKNKLTINELADKFNIGSATVKRWTKGGVYEPPQRKGRAAKEIETQEHEPRRMGRKPTFGATDEALLSKIGEKGYSEAMTFAKWLNATAVKRPNVAISTALGFFKAWWDRQGKTSAEVLAEVATEVATEVETEVDTEVATGDEAVVDVDPGADAEAEGDAESDGEGDEVGGAVAGEADALDDDGELSADPDSQGDAGAVAVGADDYEVCATT
jgi:transcriptional regulator with XRE-family HTH domain